MQPGLFDDAPRRRRLTPVVTEIQRRETAYDRVLARLRKGPATNVELNVICFRYGGRIHEMRQAGLHIEKVKQGKGVYTYILKEPV